MVKHRLNKASDGSRVCVILLLEHQLGGYGQLALLRLPSGRTHGDVNEWLYRTGGRHEVPTAMSAENVPGGWFESLRVRGDINGRGGAFKNVGSV